MVLLDRIELSQLFIVIKQFQRLVKYVPCRFVPLLYTSFKAALGLSDALSPDLSYVAKPLLRK